MLKKNLFVFLLLLVSFFWAVKLIKAAEEASVAATVSAVSLSVSVADGSVSYGTLSVGSSATTAINDGDALTDSQAAVNIGSTDQKISVRGQNSSPDNWTLAAAPAGETYSHDFCTSDCDGTPSWTDLSTGNQALVASLGVGATQNFDLRLRMPTSTTHYDPQTISVTIQAALPD